MLQNAWDTAPIWALGTMSGTSLDGVDAAMVLTDGVRIFELGRTAYRPYAEAERTVLRAALGRWDDPKDAARVVEAAHLELLGELSGADIIGFHGQTVAHDPAAGRTCQVGDGRRLAQELDRPVAWDFRSADVAAGGQGAPLAPFFHHAAMRHIGRDVPVAVLNLGGVGNLTWLDPSLADPADPQACLAFDTGPANAPLNDLMRARAGQDRDSGGEVAAAGVPCGKVVDRLLGDPYFARPAPKSLDRDAFGWLGEAVAHMPLADAAATVTRAVAETVAAGLTLCPTRPAELLVAGGGRHNATMMGMLAEATGLPVARVEKVGLDGDMLEAQAFAFLSVRVLRGLPLSAPGTTGVRVPMPGGRVSNPGKAPKAARPRAYGGTPHVAPGGGGS